MTIGERLKQAREAKEMSLEKAAQGTKIRIQFLQAIENDKLTIFASQAQGRGFARLYASFLGLDANTLFDEPVSSEVPTISQPTIKNGENPVENKEEEIPAQKKERVSEKITENANPRARFKDLIPKENELSQSNLLFKEIGEELRLQRESLGLTLADVERLTKIRELYIYNLEQGNVDALPSSVQGRGILNNYSSFLSVDPVKIQTKFAEGLQRKRLETAAIELTSFDGKTVKTKKTPVTGWRRFLTVDLLVGTSVLIILSVLVIWGVIQVVGSTKAAVEPTIDSISEVLVNPISDTQTMEPASSQDSIQNPETTEQLVNTIPVDILATITSVNTGSIQLVVVGIQRTYLKITADGKEVFNGRVVPGNAYTFTGSTKIIINTGNAAGIQVYYNQTDLGILGMEGEVVSLEFTSRGYVTSTPMFTASPTITLPPTLTPRATATPTITPTIPTPTITPKTIN